MNFVWQRIPDRSGVFSKDDDATFHGEGALTSDPANAKTLADLEYWFNRTYRDLKAWLKAHRPSALYWNPKQNWRSELWLLTDPDLKRQRGRLDFFGIAYVEIFEFNEPYFYVTHLEIFEGTKGQRRRLIPAAAEAVLRIDAEASFNLSAHSHFSWEEADILGNWLMHTRGYDMETYMLNRDDVGIIFRPGAKHTKRKA